MWSHAQPWLVTSETQVQRTKALSEKWVLGKGRILSSRFIEKGKRGKYLVFHSIILKKPKGS